jgi:hypothetical protein
MPVSPEQRKILLERLEMARKVKAEKAEGAAPAAERKRVAAAKPHQPPKVVANQLPPPSPPQPEPQPEPKEVYSHPRHDRLDKPSAAAASATTTKKNKYMKVVFYSEPPKSKVENLLKSLDDSEDAVPPAKKAAPPAKRAAPAAAPAKAKPKPARRQQGAGDDLEELARLYFS